MSRDFILHKVRTALGRSAGQPPDPPPPLLLDREGPAGEERVALFLERAAGIGARTYRAASLDEARTCVAGITAGRPGVASRAPVLADAGITALAGVASGFVDEPPLRAACAQAAVGITGADYALADTGTLVMLSSPEEARLISLLPPVHIALVPAPRILTGLDDLFTVLPDPAAITSSMVLITGPSRTADIEMVLVRGVHGPGEIHVVVVETGSSE